MLSSAQIICIDVGIIGVVKATALRKFLAQDDSVAGCKMVGKLLS